MTGKKAQKELLGLARKAISNSDNDSGLKKLKSKRLIEKRSGVFVTIFVDGELHGCIGTLGDSDVHDSIIKNAIYAAFNDPRFPPLSKEEFKRMKIHINILGEPEKLSYKDSDDLLKKIKGKGVIVKMGFASATFLPSVWEELPEPKSFMKHLCMKAGLNPDAWKNHGLEVLVYGSEEFSE